MFTNQWNAYVLSCMITESNYVNTNGIIRDTGGDTLCTIRARKPLNTGGVSLLDTNSLGPNLDRLNVGIRFGFGSTTPTVSDYKLAEPASTSQITSIAATAVGLGRIDSAGNFILPYSNTVQNKTSSAIVLQEVGLFLNLSIGTGSGDCVPVLLWRDVFDTPITLAPSETKTIETIITFPVPTA